MYVMRNLFYMLCIVFHSFHVLAGVDVGFATKKSILIKGNTCSEVNKIAQDIYTWTNAMLKLKVDIPSCFCSQDECQVDVYSISPSFVRDRASFIPGEAVTYKDGPNCFNSAFVLSGTLSKVRAVHSDEATAIYNSSLCTERALNEAIEPGDIIALRDQKNKFFEVHAAVYVSEDLMFSKKGFSNVISHSYSQNDYKRYDVTDKKCKRLQGIPKKGDYCYGKPFANVFKCNTFASYISGFDNFSKVMPKKVAELYPLVTKLETKVSKAALSGLGANANQRLRDLLTDLKSAQEAIDAIGDLNKYNDKEKEFIVLMKTRVKSLDYQMSYFLRR